MFDVPSACILAVSSLSNSTARHARHDELDWLDTTCCRRWTVERVELVEQHGSTRSTRRIRHTRLDTLKTSNVSCRDVTRRAKWNLVLTLSSLPYLPAERVVLRCRRVWTGRSVSRPRGAGPGSRQQCLDGVLRVGVCRRSRQVRTTARAVERIAPRQPFRRGVSVQLGHHRRKYPSHGDVAFAENVTHVDTCETLSGTQLLR